MQQNFYRDAAIFCTGMKKNALSSAWKITIPSAIFLTLINSLFFFRNGGLAMCVFVSVMMVLVCRMRGEDTPMNGGVYVCFSISEIA